MRDSLYTIRNYQPADFDNYVGLVIESEKLEPTGRFISSEIISERLHRPNYSPEHDLFIVETAGNIVGYMEIFPELTIGRVVVNCLVHPDHRRRGLATKLLGYAAHRANELGAKAACANVSEDDEVAKKVLSKLGFKRVRRYLELRLDITEVQGQEIAQAALSCRHLQHWEEDKLTQIQNRSFAGTWGYNPNTVKEIVYRTNLSNSSPEDVILVYEEDKIIGYCWTKVNYKATTKTRRGQIFMLGVGPDYRGRGIGKQVLLAGLSHLKSKGLQEVELTVDSGNPAARSLYRSVGFKIQASNLWYEKAIC